MDLNQNCYKDTVEFIKKFKPISRPGKEIKDIAQRDVFQCCTCQQAISISQWREHVDLCYTPNPSRSFSADSGDLEHFCKPCRVVINKITVAKYRTVPDEVIQVKYLV